MSDLPTEEPARSSRRRLVVVAVLVAVVGLGLAGMRLVAPATSMAAPVAADGAFSLDDVRPGVAAQYRHAADHADVYRRVPCYCGCDSFDDHANLFDCFVMPEGGWERHAAGCGVCQAESDEVKRLLEEERSPTEIRDAVIEGFGPATNPTTT